MKDKKKKARMNLITLYPVVIKLNFTLSSKYDIIIRREERRRRKESKKNTLSY